MITNPIWEQRENRRKGDKAWRKSVKRTYANVRVGQNVSVRIDAYPGQTRIGIVKEIWQLGKTVIESTKFLVKVTFDRVDDLMIGMHMTGKWS